MEDEKSVNMFVALVNAVIWCAIVGWLFPGIFWYMVTFWIVIILALAAMKVGFWEVATPDSNDSRAIDIEIDGKKYSGTLYKKDN